MSKFITLAGPRPVDRPGPFFASPKRRSPLESSIVWHEFILNRSGSFVRVPARRAPNLIAHVLQLLFVAGRLAPLCCPLSLADKLAFPFSFSPTSNSIRARPQSWPSERANELGQLNARPLHKWPVFYSNCFAASWTTESPKVARPTNWPARLAKLLAPITLACVFSPTHSLIPLGALWAPARAPHIGAHRWPAARPVHCAPLGAPSRWPGRRAACSAGATREPMQIGWPP